MKQLTLDFYFCGKKTKRDDSDLDDDDILECFEEAKRKQEEEENQKLMELIWENFEEEFLEEMAQREYYASGEAARDLRKEMERKEPYRRELTSEERIERKWNVGRLEDTFKYLPGNEDTLERKYWVDSEKIRIGKKISEDPYY